MPQRTFYKLLLAVWMGNGFYLVPSRSRPGEYHAVDTTTDQCPCEDKQINKVKECWHLKEIRKISHWANEVRNQTAS